MKQKQRIGLIDADLLDNGTRHPNLALMKVSQYMKDHGHATELLLTYQDIEKYDEIYLSQVFSSTKIPFDIPECPDIHKTHPFKNYPNIRIGGTGFFFDKAPDLPPAIEHHMPDYHLYDRYVAREIGRGIRASRFSDYQRYSIGFMTRGCYRKCEFCVNRKYNHVVRHSPAKEFFDSSRPHIYLWDDNILAYPRWREIFEELASVGRRFQFRQGLDIRLLTEEKAAVLSKSKYIGDFIFAFDHWRDREIIEKNLQIWRRHSNKTTKLYILCAFESQDSKDILSVFKRIKVLMGYRCLPYIMRFDSYKNSPFMGIYINLARWCNQPNFFKKKSFREYCEANGRDSSTMRYLIDFERKHPKIARDFFNLKFEKAPRRY